MRKIKNIKIKREVIKKRIKNKKDNKKNRNNIISENFIFALKYLKNLKNYFWFSFLLFFAAILFGFFFPLLFQDAIKNLVSSLIEKTSGMNSIELIQFILLNNLKASFSPFVLGIIFGIFPILSLIINGYVLGFVAGKTVAVGGIIVLWKLFPHGIFEIPAVLISVSLGLKLGMFQLSGKDKLRGFLSLLVSIIVFILLSPLLFFIFYLLSLLIGSNPLEINNITSPILLGTILLMFIFSVYIGLLVMSNEDRKLVLDNFRNYLKDSLRVFLFIVIPFLIIAAIIEGSLIILLG